MPSAACTAACTSEAENANAAPLDHHPGTPSLLALNPPPSTLNPQPSTDHAPADPLVGLAAAIAALSPADRARLAAMLVNGGEN